MSSAQGGFFDNLVTAARENPLAAALIGGGALWLLAGDEKLKSSARSAAAAASTVAETGTSGLRAAASAIQRTAAPPTAPEMEEEPLGAGEALRNAGSTASDASSDTIGKIRDRIDEGAAFARENFGKLGNPLPGQETLKRAQSSLADILERQPLVLGVVGLAIGAAVAGAFQASNIESEYIGEISDDVKADLNRRAGAVSQALREASDTLVAEVSDTGAEVVDRVKQTGLNAAQAATAKVKST